MDSVEKTVFLSGGFYCKLKFKQRLAYITLFLNRECHFVIKNYKKTGGRDKLVRANNPFPHLPSHFWRKIQAINIFHTIAIKPNFTLCFSFKN